jgi:hypothetical protein
VKDHGRLDAVGMIGASVRTTRTRAHDDILFWFLLLPLQRWGTVNGEIVCFSNSFSPFFFFCESDEEMLSEERMGSESVEGSDGNEKNEKSV